MARSLGSTPAHRRTSTALVVVALLVLLMEMVLVLLLVLVQPFGTMGRSSNFPGATEGDANCSTKDVDTVTDANADADAAVDEAEAEAVAWTSFDGNWDGGSQYAASGRGPYPAVTLSGCLAKAT